MNQRSFDEDSVSKLSRRQRERLQRRADILQAAEQVFAEKGYHAASIEEIAHTAEYASGTVYLYFKDKEALYIELFEDKIRAMSLALQTEAARGKDPLDALQKLIRARMDYFEQNRQFFSIYAREGMNVFAKRDGRWSKVAALYEEFLAMVARLIQSGQRRRVFRKGRPREFALALSGMMMQLTRDWLQSQDNAPLSRRTRFVLDLFLQGVQMRQVITS